MRHDRLGVGEVERAQQVGQVMLAVQVIVVHLGDVVAVGLRDAEVEHLAEGQHRVGRQHLDVGDSGGQRLVLDHAGCDVDAVQHQHELQVAVLQDDEVLEGEQAQLDLVGELLVGLADGGHDVALAS